MKLQEKLAAIALAINIRDNNGSMQPEKLKESLKELNKYQMFSIRQIGNIANKPASSLYRFLQKEDRYGGKLNPAHLETLRSLIFQNDRGQVDYHAAGKMVKEGTSIDTIHKFTNIPKSTIYRKCKDV